MSHPSVEAVTIAILPSNFRGFELIFNFAVVKKKRLVSTPALFSIITITIAAIGQQVYVHLLTELSILSGRSL